MRVCFLNDISILGGGEHWVLRMTEWLARHGHEASVACPYRSALFRECLERGIDVHGYQFFPGVPFETALRGFLASRRIQALYCTVITRFSEARVLSDVVAGRAAFGDDNPFLVLKTGLPPITGVSPSDYGFGGDAAVRRLHVVSEQNRREFVEWQGLQGASAEYVATVPEGVDLTRFDASKHPRAEERARWGFSDEETVVTCAARLNAQKGQDNLLLAFAETRKQRPNLRLVLAGEGEDRERLLKLRDHLGLNGAVRFAGDVREMPSLLAASDVFCHPSLADGFPNALAEAMAMGLGVIASRVGGVPDVLRHDANGRMVEPHDIHGLIREMSDLVDHPERCHELGEEARRDAHILLDFDKCSEAWLASLEAEEERYRQPETRAFAPPPVRKSIQPVLFVLSTLRTGGEETEVAILARYLNRSAYPLSVLSLYEVPEDSPAKARLEQLRVPIDTVCHGLASTAEKVLYLERKIRAEGIRVVVACQDVSIAHAAMLRIPESECALVEHAGIVEEVRRVPKNRTARLVGVSPAIRDAAKPLFRDRSRALFLPSMVDMAEYERLDRETLRRELGFGDETVVLFVGRLDAKKGIDDLIEAARTLLPRLPKLRFLIVGPADAFQRDYAKQLMERAYSLFGARRFTFSGARQDIPAVMKAADIVVLPSRGEGMSHVINEAGAAGTPVIAYEDGAAREQLCNGDAGVLVPPGDIVALTEAIEQLALDSAKRLALGERHWLHVFQNYGARRVTEQWHQLLRDVCAPLPKSAPPVVVRKFVSEELDFPAEIQVETNTACNATCIMCPYPEVSKELPQGRMSVEMYDDILRQCEGQPHLWRIEPFLNNEPFTDTRMCDFLARTKARLPHIMLTVTTNGSLLFPKVTDQLVKTGLDGIWFSFNGATKETYEHIMGLKFDVVKRNIDYLLDVKPDSLRVFTNMIETEPMRGEIEENIRYWQSRGVQSGSSPLVNRAGNVKNFVELNYKPVAPKPVRICDLLYRKMYIGYNGDALLCCMDWRRKVVLGNVGRQSIREIWRGEPYRHYRSLHEEGRVAELSLCNDCTYVQN